MVDEKMTEQYAEDNAWHRKEYERITLQERNERIAINLALEALREVERVAQVEDTGTYFYCLWCGREKSFGHFEDCKREMAIAMLGTVIAGREENRSVADELAY